MNEIAANPYLLCEEYVPTTADWDEQEADLDRKVATDRQIDFFTIDIGLFPDERTAMDLRTRNYESSARW